MTISFPGRAVAASAVLLSAATLLAFSSPAGARRSTQGCPHTSAHSTCAASKLAHKGRGTSGNHAPKGSHAKRKHKLLRSRHPRKSVANSRAHQTGSAATCDDGSDPTQSGDGTCQDGSSPTCADGSNPTLASDSATPLCGAAAGAGTGTSVPITATAPICGDGSDPNQSTDGYCQDGADPTCADGSDPTLSSDNSTLVCMANPASDAGGGD